MSVMMSLRSTESETAMENKETEDNEVIALLSAEDSASVPWCGICCCRPRCLQIFAKPICVLVVLTTYCFIEATIVSGKEEGEVYYTMHTL